MLLGTTITFTFMGTRYWCFGLALKPFPSTIFFIIKIHPSNETNLGVVVISSFLLLGTTIIFSSIGTGYRCFHLAINAFLSIVFIIIKVHPSNKTYLNSHNNLRFVIQHYIPIPLIRIHEINALVWQKKLYFPPFSLKSMFLYQMWQTWTLIITLLFFFNWALYCRHLILFGLIFSNLEHGRKRRRCRNTKNYF